MASFKSAAVLARQFSTTGAVQAQMVKPPIAIFGTEGRYANALYSAASKQKQLDVVEKDLLKFQAAIKSDKKLAEFLANPLVNKNLKSRAIENGLKKLNYSSLSTNLFCAMAENGRMKYTDAVINAFSRIMSAERGEVRCEVTTSKPLKATTEKELETALKMFIKKGQNILITKKVDPSILGGMVVSIGDKYVDMSIASKIKTYTAVIKQAV